MKKRMAVTGAIGMVLALIGGKTLVGILLTAIGSALVAAAIFQVPWIREKLEG